MLGTTSWARPEHMGGELGKLTAPLISVHATHGTMLRQRLGMGRPALAALCDSHSVLYCVDVLSVGSLVVKSVERVPLLRGCTTQ